MNPSGIWLDVTPEFMLIGLPAPFGPLIFLLLGIGLLHIPTFPRWAGAI